MLIYRQSQCAEYFHETSSKFSGCKLHFELQQIRGGDLPYNAGFIFPYDVDWIGLAQNLVSIGLCVALFWLLLDIRQRLKALETED